MLEPKIWPLVLLGLVWHVLGSPAQQPLMIQSQSGFDAKPHKLRGRFLHITDMHPDPHYRVGSSGKKACHRGQPKEGKAPAAYYGLSYSDCDSPFSLTNHTLDFLDREWADDIDFVIWTGDSARHDNDRRRPRTTAEIYALNRAMARKMEEVFTRKGIPVVPSIGNNDVWRECPSSVCGSPNDDIPPTYSACRCCFCILHELVEAEDEENIMLPGPNSITSEFSSIWRSFVPFPAYQVFQRGGYFSVEVVPNAVAVISLNTMYFYDSNTAVGGCEYPHPEDPGNLQFDWLEVQLDMFRERKMQVWLSGHIPPSSRNYFPECYVRYVELSLRYQDTILGHLYGHMNIDHFFLLDAEQFSRRRNTSMTYDDGAVVLKHNKKELYRLLLQEFAELPKAENLNHDNYGVVNVAPSLVPTYLPSFRIFAYNTSGERYEPGVPGEEEEQPGGSRSLRDVVGELCADEEFENTWRCKLTRSWHTSPKSPSRTNTLWTPLGYAQYYMPGLDEAEKGDSPKFKLEYVTFSVHALHGTGGGSAVAAEGGGYPIPKRHLPRSLRNSTVSKSKRYAPYRLEDLTIPSWTGLGRRLGRKKGKELRQRFKEFMYMGGGVE